LYDELGLDSFDAFMLLLLIESLAGVDFPPDTPPALWTLGDGFNYYSQLVVGSSAHPGA
jgi:acyl carrier protein